MGQQQRDNFAMVPKVNNVYAICAFAAIGGGLFGFDISSMSGVLGTNAYKNYFGNPQGTKVCSRFHMFLKPSGTHY